MQKISGSRRHIESGLRLRIGEAIFPTHEGQSVLFVEIKHVGRVKSFELCQTQLIISELWMKTAFIFGQSRIDDQFTPTNYWIF